MDAPKRIWTLHDGGTGRYWLEGPLSDYYRKFAITEYILAAEHERLMAEARNKALENLSSDHRSFPDAGDGRPSTPMAVALWAAGCDLDTARFVARQLAGNGIAMIWHNDDGTVSYIDAGEWATEQEAE